jgi:hypothetical protein
MKYLCSSLLFFFCAWRWFLTGPGGGRVWPVPGYWSYTEYVEPSACPLDTETCPGVDSAFALNTDSPWVDTSRCATGYDGAVCNECAGGYYQLQGRCFKCNDKIDQRAVIGLICCIGLGVMALLSLGVAFLQAMTLAETMQWFAVLQGLIVVAVEGIKQNEWNKELISNIFTYLNAINFGQRWWWEQDTI